MAIIISFSLPLLIFFIVYPLSSIALTISRHPIVVFSGRFKHLSTQTQGLPKISKSLKYAVKDEETSGKGETLTAPTAFEKVASMGLARIQTFSSVCGDKKQTSTC